MTTRALKTPDVRLIKHTIGPSAGTGSLNRCVAFAEGLLLNSVAPLMPLRPD
jgi:hypothetical protein